MKAFLLTLTLAVPANAIDNVRHFESKNHSFAVDYPAQWNRMTSDIVGYNVDRDKLHILSFPNRERVEAVVIKQGGAEIILEAGSVPTLAHEDVMVDSKTITLSFAPFCSSVSVVRVKWPVVTADETPSHVAVYKDATTFECAKGTKHFTLFLNHWQDDPKHDRYEQTALSILKTLRTSH